MEQISSKENKRIKTIKKLLSSASFRREEGVFVACPELCLLQLASTLSLVDTIKVAMSFCGIYKLVGDTVSKSIFDRAPIMTVDSALSYLDCVGEVPGVLNERKALQYVLPNSGSPMETRMVLPFYLPKRMGGYGLPKPVMNRTFGGCGNVRFGGWGGTYEERRGLCR